MKKKVSLKQLEKTNQYDDYQDEVRKISQLISQGKLIPMKSARSNGRYPALPLSYWMIVEDAADYRQELSMLQYMIKPEYYQHHQRDYEKVRKYVLMLDDYLNHQHHLLDYPASRRERSYEIFGYEKVLDEHPQMLAHLGISDEDLNMYEVFEPIAYYTNGTFKNLLIVENSSPYFTIRELLINGQTTLFDVPIDTIVYGSGKSAYKAFKDMKRAFAPHDLSSTMMYYVGDIDCEGLNILLKLHQDFGFIPFIPMYEAMMKQSSGKALQPMPTTQKPLNPQVESLFDAHLYASMTAILAKGYYIPQEILSMKDLKNKNV